MKRNIKLAYIGGGSKQWARIFMNDLALTDGLSGQVMLYDTDVAAAERNCRIGTRIAEDPACVSGFSYSVGATLEETLRGADVVVISILPGTFSEMQSDVHAPEAYGIYQTVGDTAGPGGVLRAMRTVPLYEGFARAIERCCPRAWVLNLTNPMSVCTGALYAVYPKIKAFGCCHEVFHAQDFLCAVHHETTGEPLIARQALQTEVCGLNHFTWITSARYQEQDVLSMLPAFMEKYFASGYCASDPADPMLHRKGDYFQCGNRVKMDLFRRFGALGAAGDRHLVEFLDRGWYLSDPEPFASWGFYRTPVDFRVKQQRALIEEGEALAWGKKPIALTRSDEELMRMLMALLGGEKLLTNVNLPNVGQTPTLPLGTVVETNCLFASDSLCPVAAKPLPAGVDALVQRSAHNNNALLDACLRRDEALAFQVFMNQPLCAGLALADGERLFAKMCRDTAAYLTDWKGNWQEEA
ncbi:MAG: alpha-glucosidase/alpha-galactosidase [Clostridia bacterium]|nr:alpha-glucosidase/alpha-galactosidase [Clostridia bacterium]